MPPTRAATDPGTSPPAATADTASNHYENPTMLTQPSPLAGSTFDLAALRLPTNYGATLGVKKILTAVPIRKPNKAQFYRAHPDANWSFNVFGLELKEQQEFYVVSQAVAQALGNVVRAVVLYTAVDRGDNPFLIPVYLPGEDGRSNQWHESRAQAVELAKTKWLRIEANMAAGRYDILVAQGELPDPTWPDGEPDDFFRIAFRDKTISELTHPVVQTLQGRV